MLTTLRANAWKYTAIAATLGLGAMLLVQTIRLADAEKDALTATTNLANERGAHERAAREQAEVNNYGVMTPARAPLDAAHNYYPANHARLPELLPQLGADSLASSLTRVAFAARLAADAGLANE